MTLGQNVSSTITEPDTTVRRTAWSKMRDQANPRIAPSTTAKTAEKTIAPLLKAPSYLSIFLIFSITSTRVL
jgi:hypothetical protein